jgi:hypothetical protein
VSATPFGSLTFSEPSGNIFDQYFGDVFVGAAIVSGAVICEALDRLAHSIRAVDLEEIIVKVGLT